MTIFGLRHSAFLGLLILFSTLTILAIYIQAIRGSDFIWTSQYTGVIIHSGNDDQGKDESNSGTSKVTIARPTPITVLPKVPGPAFCDVCGPYDDLCNTYGLKCPLPPCNIKCNGGETYGEPIKIGVIGGSVSKGHGIARQEHRWFRRFEAAWKELFPKSETTVIDGAVPATGSDYFSMCFGEHIPEDVDLVLVELLINDERLERNAVSFEWLMRGLLDLPNQPAVINMHTISLFFNPVTTGGDLHVPIAAYYDSPIISMRNMIAPHILKNKDLEKHYFTIQHNGQVDLRHVGFAGHIMMSELLVAYTQRQICAVELENIRPNRFISEDGKLEGYNELGGIPRLRLFQKYDDTTVTGRIKPFCQSIRTDKHPLVPIETRGWSRWVYKNDKEKPYLVANQPKAYAKFSVEVSVMGRVRITYLKSKTFGLGDVWCWIDDDKDDGTKVSGWWDLDGINVARVAVITEKATPGKHTLTCEILSQTFDPGGKHEFRLIAIDAA